VGVILQNISFSINVSCFAMSIGRTFRINFEFLFFLAPGGAIKKVGMSCAPTIESRRGCRKGGGEELLGLANRLEDECDGPRVMGPTAVFPCVSMSGDGLSLRDESVDLEESVESFRQGSAATEVRMRVRDSGLLFGLLEVLLLMLEEEDEPWLEVREMKVLELERVRVGCEAPLLGFMPTTGMAMVVDPESDR
jgi:hypothetical protein